MYIGQYYFFGLKDVWLKNTANQCALFTSDSDGRLKPVIDKDPDSESYNTQKVVFVYNVIGTFAPKVIRFPEIRYCTIEMIDGSYWLVSAEC